MASIYTGSTGVGSPYPNQFRLDYTITEISGGHRVIWEVYPDGGTTGYSQNFWNGVVYYQVGSADPVFVWGNIYAGISGNAVQGTRLANGSFDVSHTDAVNLKLLVGGGYYAPTAYAENYVVTRIGTDATAPSGLRVVNARSVWEGGKNPNFYITVAVDDFGTGGTSRQFKLIKSYDGKILSYNPAEGELSHEFVFPAPAGANIGHLISISAGNGSKTTALSNIYFWSAPFYPTNVRVSSVGADTATVLWTANVGRGEGESTTYEISLDGGLSWIEAGDASETSRSYVLTGLTPGTEYTMKLRALNEGGEAVADDIVFTTLSAPRFYLPVKEEGAEEFTTKRMQKFYVGVKEPVVTYIENDGVDITDEGLLISQMDKGHEYWFFSSTGIDSVYRDEVRVREARNIFPEYGLEVHAGRDDVTLKCSWDDGENLVTKKAKKLYGRDANGLTKLIFSGE